jgi:hypothetical protein
VETLVETTFSLVETTFSLVETSVAFSTDQLYPQVQHAHNLA